MPCRFFIWISRVFKARIVFSMKVFVFFGFRHFVRRCCAVFSYECIGFLRPELFFQWKCLFFGFRHFVRRCFAVFSFEFIIESENIYGIGNLTIFRACKNWKNNYIDYIFFQFWKIFFRQNEFSKYLSRKMQCISEKIKISILLKFEFE